jgi:hypothetical protein
MDQFLRQILITITKPMGQFHRRIPNHNHTANESFSAENFELQSQLINVLRRIPNYNHTSQWVNLCGESPITITKSMDQFLRQIPNYNHTANGSIFAANSELQSHGYGEFRMIIILANGRYRIQTTIHQPMDQYPAANF